VADHRIDPVSGEVYLQANTPRVCHDEIFSPSATFENVTTGMQSGPVASTPRELQRILAAERAGAPFLQWRSGGQLRTLTLDAARGRVTIGRDGGSDVPLAEDQEVSRTHAILEPLGGEWMLVDDGISRNGSFVNAVKVLGRQRLADGDRLCVGSTEMIFHAGAEPRPAATQTASESRASLTLSPMQRRVLIALCRPVHDSESATPATNRDVAEEVFLSVDAVKAHLRVLFERFGLSELPQNEKRARLVASVLVSGLISPREF
jgi:hypothetical protein